MIRRRPGFTMIELVVVVAIIAVLISLILPAVQAAREGARRAQCSNNLLQLGIAIENYEATNQVLPPGVIDSKAPIIETPASYQFGWICRILPFLEQKNVYKNLDFNAGLYTPNNLTARGVPMYVLLCPSEGRRNGYGSRSPFQNFGAAALPPGNYNPEPATTSYAACHHDVEAPIDAGNNGVFFLNSHVRPGEIEDGLACTIFAGEKLAPGDELGWASGTRATLRNTGTPMNLTFLQAADLSPFMADLTQPGSSLPPGTSAIIPVGGFGSSHPGGANFLFGDGSVRFLKNKIDGRIYHRLGNRADGEPIGSDQF